MTILEQNTVRPCPSKMASDTTKARPIYEFARDPLRLQNGSAYVEQHSQCTTILGSSENSHGATILERQHPGPRLASQIL